MDRLIFVLPADMYEDVKEYLNWYDTRKDMSFAPDAPVIGLVLQRSHLVTGDEGHYSGVVSEMESLGAKVGTSSNTRGLICYGSEQVSSSAGDLPKGHSRFPGVV